MAGHDVSELRVKQDGDEMLAESLQLQELLLSSSIADDEDDGRPRSTNKAKTPSVGDSKGKQLEEYYQLLKYENGAGEFYCSICMEDKPLAESFDVRPCSHVFCAGCLAQYIASKVEANVTSIGCPDPACGEGALEAEACRGILPEGVYSRWGSALCEQAVGAMRFYCPHKDCSALLIDDAGEEIMEAECPHCHRLFCARCKVPWHDGIDCEGFQRLAEEEKGPEDLMLRKMAVNSKWQRCPLCKMFVERIDGCVYIKCRCGHRFCYLCASPMSSGNHHCNVCDRTW